MTGAFVESNGWRGGRLRQLVLGALVGSAMLDAACQRPSSPSDDTGTSASDEDAEDSASPSSSSSPSTHDSKDDQSSEGEEGSKDATDASSDDEGSEHEDSGPETDATGESDAADESEGSSEEGSSDESGGDSDDVDWSQKPPKGLSPDEVPQFVALTFDDNFGLENTSARGGVDWVVQFTADLRNPAGSGQSVTFDGAPVRTSFFHTSMYIAPASAGGNLPAWRSAFSSGHEAANHTVRHLNGGDIDSGSDPCCVAQHFTVDAWRMEISACTQALSHMQEGIGADAEDIIGFRAPFLAFNDALYAALGDLSFVFDSSLMNCFGPDEDGRNCAWPYTLHRGSPDIDHLSDFVEVPTITAHPGLWELAPSTLIVPPDEMAEKYGFSPGLRARIPEDMSYPDVYDRTSGKLAGLDYTLLISAGMSPEEMAATLKYSLDLRLEGNRSPLIFVAHAHMYAFSNPTENPDTPSAEVRDARQRAIQDFVNYALRNASVRIRPARDIVAWMRDPKPLRK